MPTTVIEVDNKQLADQIQYRLDRLERARAELQANEARLSTAGNDPGSNTPQQLDQAIENLRKALGAVNNLCGWQGMFCKFVIEK